MPQHTPHAGNTPALGKGCDCLFRCAGECNCDTPSPKQPPPMGSASRAILRRYADDLRPFAERGDRLATSMLECCDFLLVEADRLERGRA